MTAKRAWAALVAAALIWPAVPASAQEEPQVPPLIPPVAGRVELTPLPGTTIDIDGRHYRGTIAVTGHRPGLSLVETVGVDDYLLGIREVPFSWHPQALRAQAVAARTYLAHTLAAGRGSQAQRYDYDICATSACQVYAGVDGVEADSGERWRSAVRDTAGEILVFDGQPALAVYGSTTGGRTRSSEDVWPGEVIPYLRAVDSPGEESPFVSWRFELTPLQMGRLLEAAGVSQAPLKAVWTTKTADGQGPWQVSIASAEGVVDVSTWDLRGMLNRVAAEVLPHVLPAERPDGRRYPQAILSPTYTITQRFSRDAGNDGAPLAARRRYVIEGSGWGHMVGMSQYGAQAMAEDGATYGEILAHYYSGLVPEARSDLLPGTVKVGLVVEASTIAIGADGPVRVTIDGQPLDEPFLGSWRFESLDGQLLVIPPAGWGSPPRLLAPFVRPGPDAMAAAVGAVLTAPAEVVATAWSGSLMIGRVELGVLDAGAFSIPWHELVGAVTDDSIMIEFEATSGADSATVALAVIPLAD